MFVFFCLSHGLPEHFTPCLKGQLLVGKTATCSSICLSMSLLMVSKPVLIEMDPYAEKNMQVKQGESMNKKVQVSDAWLWRTTGLWTAYI